jgi:hypothetical protein
MKFYEIFISLEPIWAKTIKLFKAVINDATTHSITILSISECYKDDCRY